MKRIILIFIALTCIISVLISCISANKKCNIKGKTVGVSSKFVLLLKANEDFRFDGIEIPIQNNSFQYEVNFKEPEVYKLMLGEARQDGGRDQSFFIEPGEVFLTIYPENEFDKNIVNGSYLNKQYRDFTSKEESLFKHDNQTISDSLDLLWKSGTYFSDAMKDLQKQIGNIPDHSSEEFLRANDRIKELKDSGKDLTEMARALESKQEISFQNSINRQFDYINKNASIVSYYILFDLLTNIKEKADLNLANKCYQKLSSKYPDHPYNLLVSNLLESIRSIHIGGRYIDFSALDKSGKVFNLSEVVKGKVALIDLWSTWCGPCIATSRSLIPVYEAFKNTGFTIVGVVADKEIKRIQERTEKESYPWLNLLEVDKQNKIWDKYGISNSGGGTFLIDKEGIIVAINPTADEVRDKLVKLLN